MALTNGRPSREEVRKERPAVEDRLLGGRDVHLRVALCALSRQEEGVIELHVGPAVGPCDRRFGESAHDDGDEQDPSELAHWSLHPSGPSSGRTFLGLTPTVARKFHARIGNQPWTRSVDR